MSNEYLVNSDDLTGVADAIREKGGTNEQLVFPSGFVSAIENITCGGSNMPQFTYSVDGGYTTERDNMTGDWKIRFIKSGKLTFTSNPPLIDINVVGGGGGSSGDDSFSGPTAGGGGYTKIKIGYQPEINKEYTITIGAGGSAGSVTGDGGRGGSSSAFGITAEGGYGGQFVSGKGGNGGSGGNAYASNKPSATDGANGYSGSYQGVAYPGGTGQGTTTREFGESNGVLYAAGGGTDSSSSPGASNTGNGGGSYKSGAAAKGVSGGSGIVVIRGSL